MTTSEHQLAILRARLSHGTQILEKRDDVDRKIGMSKIIWTLILGVFVAICNGRSPTASAEVLSSNGEQTTTVDEQKFKVYTFQPTGCSITGVLIVLHGVDRNPDAYRDDAIFAAQRDCLFVIAPLFSRQDFPNWRYQLGGIVHDGMMQPSKEWTTKFLPDLAAWARAEAGLPNVPYVLMGHSAGAQFLDRVAAYQPGDARRIVIANPSTWVRPRLDIAAPYGFGLPFPPGEAEAALRRYLALPITVLLGSDDIGSHNLASSEEAMAQGATRIGRGRTVFAEAEQTARAHGWPFNWHLSIMPGIGHNARLMLATPAAFEALVP